MTTDNKTLADVQPGGRVRLGDGLPPLPEPSVTVYGFDSVLRRVPMSGYTAEQMQDYARAALSAQPSPGGQDALLPCPFCGESMTINGAGDGVHPRDSDCILAQHVVVADHAPHAVAWNRRALAARQPVEFERAIPTRRRESAVELLLQLGFVWNNQRWEDRRQPVKLIAQKVGDYRVTVAEDAITVSRGRDIVFAYSAGDAEPINALQSVDPERGHIDPSWPLHDRVEFALRDAGFDLDEAAFVAESVVAQQNAAVDSFARQPVGEPDEPIFQVKHHDDTEATWRDATEAAYEMQPAALRRIVYTTLPAHAVDLGKLQRYSKSYSEGIYLDDAGDWVRFADVRSLIDSQAVGNG